jgi:branched-chain amino acid transport system ATP-binding protein
LKEKCGSVPQAGGESTMKLEVKEVSKSFGGIRAVNNVSFKVEGNELIGLIGPNGSGKTTLVNLIGGIFKPEQGAITFQGERIDGLPPYEIAKRGIGRTFQITQVFRRMSVLENLLVPALAVSANRSKEQLTEKALEILDFLTLDHLKNEYAKNLSGGQQKLLELGRVLMLDPDIILLDEPFAGVHPELREKIYDYIKKVHAKGKAFIIISHDMNSIFTLSERLMVLNHGEKIADGDPVKLKNDERVIEAYIGD